MSRGPTPNVKTLEVLEETERVVGASHRYVGPYNYDTCIGLRKSHWHWQGGGALAVDSFGEAKRTKEQTDHKLRKVAVVDLGRWAY